MRLIVTVVREHGAAESVVTGGEWGARSWLVGALYLVEDERLPETAPTPTLAELRSMARDNGWEVHVAPYVEVDS